MAKAAVTQLMPIVTMEAVAAVLGFLCVVLYIRQNIWSWPVGLVQITLFLFVFYEARLYSDLVLHIIYLFMQVYGWNHWRNGGDQGAALLVTRLPGLQICLWAGAAAIGSLAAGSLVAAHTDAAAPFADTFVAVTSLVAQWLITRKKLESWLFWFAVDLVAIGIYYYKGLYFATTLYLLYLGLAVAGYLSWRKSSSPRSGPERRSSSSPA